MQLAATVRLARPGIEAEVITGQFSALPSGFAALMGWLLGYRSALWCWRPPVVTRIRSPSPPPRALNHRASRAR